MMNLVSLSPTLMSAADPSPGHELFTSSPLALKPAGNLYRGVHTGRWSCLDPPILDPGAAARQRTLAPTAPMAPASRPESVPGKLAPTWALGWAAGDSPLSAGKCSSASTGRR